MKIPPRPSVRSLANRDALIEQYMRLPHYVVNRLWKYNPVVRRFGYDNAVQTGMVRLIRAAELWEDDRHVQFMSYAYRAISSGICEEADKLCRSNNCLSHTVSLPVADTAGKEASFLPPVSDKSVLESREALELWELLPERMKTIVWLTIVEGEGYREVGARYGISKERVRQIKFAALKWLKRKMDGECPALLTEVVAVKVGGVA